MTKPVPYPFAVGERVTGPGVCGEVVAIHSRYSVVVRQDRDRKTEINSTLGLEKETKT